MREEGKRGSAEEYRQTNTEIKKENVEGKEDGETEEDGIK